jgi:hypothetical protein
MTPGKFFYYVLWLPILITGAIVWLFDKTNWVIENLFQVAKNLHEDIKEF